MIEPSFTTEKVDESQTQGAFHLSPLPQGFGHTLGNAYRRTLLSSLGGTAATYVKINDAVHPFSTLTGVKQTVLDIILNIKLLRFTTKGKGPFTMKLSARGKGSVTAKDFEGGDIEIVNVAQEIAELTTAGAKLDIEIIADEGYGYSPAEEKEKKEFGMLAVDSVFSPVVNVNFKVEGARVGRKSNFDKLVLDITTDGSIAPSEALRGGSELLSSFFAYALSGKDKPQKDGGAGSLEQELTPEVDKKVYQTIIDELDLPTRVVNALLRENIETVEDLLKRGQDELVGLKGVGRKSLDLIEKELEKLGIPFQLEE